MPLDKVFYDAVAPLAVPGYGTEEVGPLLYSLVRMTRPQNVLEVGLGYTSPFLARALADNIDEFAADREIVRQQDTGWRRATLSAEYHANDYTPVLHAIDDFSLAESSAPKVLNVLGGMELRHLVQVSEGDFRGKSREIAGTSQPFDFVWFDCGGVDEYVDFIEEYWPLITADHGLLLLHYTYWTVEQERNGGVERKLVMGSIVNELKRQQLAAGLGATFEVLTLVEPHKTRQGSVTMIRKVTPRSMARDSDFQDEVFRIFGKRPKPMPKLR